MNGLLSFETAQVKAFWEQVLARLRGKSAQLLGFDELRKRLRFSQGSSQFARHSAV